jgi:hypothetical protein
MLEHLVLLKPPPFADVSNLAICDGAFGAHRDVEGLIALTPYPSSPHLLQSPHVSGPEVSVNPQEIPLTLFLQTHTSLPIST